MSKTSYIIPIFVPHDGCPFDCVFCNQRKITGLDTSVTKKDVETTIEEYKQTIGDGIGKHIEVAFFGGSFTGIRIDKQRELLSVAKKYKDSGYISDIRLSTRPDYINDEILDNLTQMGVTTIELGVQSLNQEVLDLSNRGHNREDVYRASKLIKDRGLRLGLQMMLGLPGDTLERAVDTAKGIIECEPSFVRIYPTLVVKGTELEKQYMDGEYRPLELEEAVEIAVKIYKMFTSAGITVIRIGLQPTDHIALDKDVVAGPFHPSFRQLAESRVIRDRVTGYVKDDFKSLAIEINPKRISDLVGNKKSNKIYFTDRYNTNNISLRPNKDLGIGKIKVIIDNNESTINIFD